MKLLIHAVTVPLVLFKTISLQLLRKALGHSLPATQGRTSCLASVFLLSLEKLCDDSKCQQLKRLPECSLPVVTPEDNIRQWLAEGENKTWSHTATDRLCGFLLFTGYLGPSQPTVHKLLGLTKPQLCSESEHTRPRMFFVFFCWEGRTVLKVFFESGHFYCFMIFIPALWNHLCPKEGRWVEGITQWWLELANVSGEAESLVSQEKWINCMHKNKKESSILKTVFLNIWIPSSMSFWKLLEEM